MKTWKCPNCSRIIMTEDNKVMVICCCQTEMEEFPYDFKREVEVYGNNDKISTY